MKRPRSNDSVDHGSATLAASGTQAVRPHPIAWGFALLTLGYAVFLAYATHHPYPDALLPGVARQPDKLLHFGAYAVLGCLATATLLAFRGRAGWLAILALFLGLAGLAALDEATQPLFRRAAEVMDWVYDMGGIAIGGVVAGTAARLAAVCRGRPAKTLT